MIFPTSRLAKTFCLGMAACLFWTQAVFLHAGESRFWEERRARIAAARDAQSLALARLPAASPQSPAALLDSLPSTPLALAAPNLQRTKQKNHASLLAALPPRLGTVRDVLTAPGRRVVVHIQDAHAQAEAQQNIGEAVRSLSAAGKVPVVGLEGTSGPMGLEAFAAFPYPDAVRDAADFLLSQGEISGPGHIALTGAAPAAFVGIDAPELYDANVDAYRRSRPLQNNFRQMLADRRQKLESEKARTYTPALLAFDRAVENHHRGALPLGAYVKTLAAAQPLADNPQARKFLAALNIEASLNFSRVERERKLLLEALLARLDAAAVNALVQQTLAYRAGDIAHGAFFQSLADLCRGRGVPLSRFPAMEAYLRYVLTADGLKAEALYAEIQNLEKRVFARLAGAPAQKQLVERSRALRLAEKLVDFSLSREEWDDYKALPRRPVDGLETFEAFYVNAVARDRAMTDRLLKAMADSKAEAAVLVAGGFHGTGLAKNLHAAGVSVISFVPRITRIEGESAAYLSIFAQEKTPLDQFLDGRQLFTAPDPVPPAARLKAGWISVAQALRLDGKADPKTLFVRLFRGPRLVAARGVASGWAFTTDWGGRALRATVHWNAAGRTQDVTVEDGPSGLGRLLRFPERPRVTRRALWTAGIAAAALFLLSMSALGFFPDVSLAPGAAEWAAERFSDESARKLAGGGAFLGTSGYVARTAAPAVVRKDLFAYHWRQGGFAGVDLDHFVYAQTLLGERLLPPDRRDALMARLGFSAAERAAVTDETLEETYRKIYRELARQGYTAEILDLINERSFSDPQIEQAIKHQSGSRRAQGVFEAVSNGLDAIAPPGGAIGQFSKGVKQILAWLVTPAQDRVDVYTRSAEGPALHLAIRKGPHGQDYIEIREIKDDHFRRVAQQDQGTVVRVRVHEAIPEEDGEASLRGILEGLQKRFPFIRDVLIEIERPGADALPINGFDDMPILSPPGQTSARPETLAGRVNVSLNRRAIAIKDSGRGMNAQTLARMFVPHLGDKQPRPLTDQERAAELERVTLVHGPKRPTRVSFARRGEVIFSVEPQGLVEGALTQGTLLAEFGRFLRTTEARHGVVLSLTHEKEFLDAVERMAAGLLANTAIADPDKARHLSTLAAGLDVLAGDIPHNQYVVGQAHALLNDMLADLTRRLKADGWVLLPHEEAYGHLDTGGRPTLYLHERLFAWNGLPDLLALGGEDVPFLSVPLEDGRRAPLLVVPFKDESLEFVRAFRRDWARAPQMKRRPVIETDHFVAIPDLLGARLLALARRWEKDRKLEGEDAEEFEELRQELEILLAHRVDSGYGPTELPPSLVVEAPDAPLEDPGALDADARRRFLADGPVRAPPQPQGQPTGDPGQRAFLRADGVVYDIDTGRALWQNIASLRYVTNGFYEAEFRSNGRKAILSTSDAGSAPSGVRMVTDPGGDLQFSPGGRYAYIRLDTGQIYSLLDLRTGRAIVLGTMEWDIEGPENGLLFAPRDVYDIHFSDDDQFIVYREQDGDFHHAVFIDVAKQYMKRERFIFPVTLKAQIINYHGRVVVLLRTLGETAVYRYHPEDGLSGKFEARAARAFAHLSLVAAFNEDGRLSLFSLQPPATTMEIMTIHAPVRLPPEIPADQVENVAVTRSPTGHTWVTFMLKGDNPPQEHNYVLMGRNLMRAELGQDPPGTIVEELRPDGEVKFFPTSLEGMPEVDENVYRYLSITAHDIYLDAATGLIRNRDVWAGSEGRQEILDPIHRETVRSQDGILLHARSGQMVYAGPVTNDLYLSKGALGELQSTRPLPNWPDGAHIMAISKPGRGGVSPYAILRAPGAVYLFVGDAPVPFFARLPERLYSYDHVAFDGTRFVFTLSDGDGAAYLDPLRPDAPEFVKPPQEANPWREEIPQEDRSDYSIVHFNSHDELVIPGLPVDRINGDAQIFRVAEKRYVQVPRNRYRESPLLSGHRFRARDHALMPFVGQAADQHVAVPAPPLSGRLQPVRVQRETEHVAQPGVVDVVAGRLLSIPSAFSAQPSASGRYSIHHAASGQLIYFDHETQDGEPARHLLLPEHEGFSVSPWADAVIVRRVFGQLEKFDLALLTPAGPQYYSGYDRIHYGAGGQVAVLKKAHELTVVDLKSGRVLPTFPTFPVLTVSAEGRAHVMISGPTGTTHFIDGEPTAVYQGITHLGPADALSKYWEAFQATGVEKRLHEPASWNTQDMSLSPRNIGEPISWMLLGDGVLHYTEDWVDGTSALYRYQPIGGQDNRDFEKLNGVRWRVRPMAGGRRWYVEGPWGIDRVLGVDNGTHMAGWRGFLTENEQHILLEEMNASRHSDQSLYTLLTAGGQTIDITDRVPENYVLTDVAGHYFVFYSPDANRLVYMDPAAFDEKAAPPAAAGESSDDEKAFTLWQTAVQDKKQDLIDRVKTRYDALFDHFGLEALAADNGEIIDRIEDVYVRQDKAVRRQFDQALADGRNGFDLDDAAFALFAERLDKILALVTPEFLARQNQAMRGVPAAVRLAARRDLLVNLLTLAADADPRAGTIIDRLDARRLVVLSLREWGPEVMRSPDRLALLADFHEAFQNAHRDAGQSVGWAQARHAFGVVGALTESMDRAAEHDVAVFDAQVRRLLRANRGRDPYLRQLARALGTVSPAAARGFLADTHAEPFREARPFLIFLTHPIEPLKEKERWLPTGVDAPVDEGLELSVLMQMELLREKDPSRGVDDLVMGVEQLEEALREVKAGARALPPGSDTLRARIAHDMADQAYAGAAAREIAQNSGDALRDHVAPDGRRGGTLTVEYYLQDNNGVEEYVEEARDNGPGAPYELALLLAGKSTKTEFSQSEFEGFFGRGKYVGTDELDRVEILNVNEAGRASFFVLAVDRPADGPIRLRLVQMRRVTESLPTGVMTRRIKRADATVPELEQMLSKRAWKTYAGLSVTDTFKIDFIDRHGQREPLEVKRGNGPVEVVAEVPFIATPPPDLETGQTPPPQNFGPLRLLSTSDMPLQTVSKRRLRVSEIPAAYLALVPRPLQRHAKELGLNIEIPLSLIGDRSDFVDADHYEKAIQIHVAVAFYRMLAHRTLNQHEPSFVFEGFPADWDEDIRYWISLGMHPDTGEFEGDPTTKALADKINEGGISTVTEEELAALLPAEDAIDTRKRHVLLIVQLFVPTPAGETSLLARRTAVYLREMRADQARRAAVLANMGFREKHMAAAEASDPHFEERVERANLNLYIRNSPINFAIDTETNAAARGLKEKILAKIQRTDSDNVIRLEDVVIVNDQAPFSGRFQNNSGRRTLFIRVDLGQRWVTIVNHEMGHFLESLMSEDLSEEQWEEGMAFDTHGFTHDEVGAFASARQHFAALSLANPRPRQLVRQTAGDIADGFGHGRATLGLGIWAARSVAKLAGRDPDVWGARYMERARDESVAVVAASVATGLVFGPWGAAWIVAFALLHPIFKNQLALYGAKPGWGPVLTVTLLQAVTFLATMAVWDLARPLAEAGLWIAVLTAAVLGSGTVYVHGKIDAMNLQKEAAAVLAARERLTFLDARARAAGPDLPASLRSDILEALNDAVDTPSWGLGRLDTTDAQSLRAALWRMDTALLRRLAARAQDRRFARALKAALAELAGPQSTARDAERFLAGPVPGLQGAGVFFIQNAESLQAITPILRLREALAQPTAVVVDSEERREETLRALTSGKQSPAPARVFVSPRGFEQREAAEDVFHLARLPDEVKAFVMEHSITPYAWRPLNFDMQDAPAFLREKFERHPLVVIEQLLRGIPMSVFENYMKELNGLLAALRAA